ncbi:hypothetical protein GCM10009647_058420 [Streptomyces sanglieri]
MHLTKRLLQRFVEGRVEMLAGLDVASACVRILGSGHRFPGMCGQLYELGGAVGESAGCALALRAQPLVVLVFTDFGSSG